MLPSDVVARLVNIVENGSLKQAKYAATILSSDGYESKCSELIKVAVLIQQSCRGLSTASDILASTLSALSVFSGLLKSQFEPYKAQVVDFVLNQLLLRNDEPADEKEVDWVPFEKLRYIGQCKVIGLKLLFASFLDADSDVSSVEDPKSVLQLIRTIIQEDGELVPGNPTGYLIFNIDRL